MRKALTPIISVVLLILLVTVSAGGAFLFITQVMGNLQETAGEAVSELPACSSVSIPVAYGDGFVLTNTGCDTITNATVLVDGELINVQLSEPLPEGDSTYVTFPENVTLYNDQDHLYKVALNNGFSTTKRIQEETASSTSGFYGRCEENQTSCTTDVFFTGDIVANDYPTCSCCGDDNNEYFYNGSIGSTHYFCHDSEYYNTTIDTNEELCTYYDHEWVSNSGEYECTESFDYTMEAGEYYGTYDFRDETVGDTGTDISFVDVSEPGCVNEVVSEIDGHKSVLKTYDISTTWAGWIHNLESSKTSGVFEFWTRIDDDSGGNSYYIFYDSSGNRAITLGFGLGNRIYYKDGSGSEVFIDSYNLDNWIHLKIKFDVGSGGDGTDDWHIWINGDQKDSEGYEWRENPSDINHIDLDPSDGNVIETDAWGQNWDSTSHDGLGYSEGLNVNPYDNSELLHDWDLGDLGYGCGFNIADEVDGHKNVLNISDYSDDNRVWLIHNKSDAGYEKGNIEWWWKTTNSSERSYFSVLNSTGDTQIELFIDNGVLNYWNGSRITFGEINNNQWYYFRIDFDATSESFDLYKDEVLIRDDLIFHHSGETVDLANVHVRTLTGWHNTGVESYYDAIGYSWDSSYHVGDNLEQFGCCGDDKISDEFYNIASNATFCYEGVKTSDVDETKREWCELNQYNVWFSGSNSGSDSPCCGDDGYNLRDGLVSHWKFDETSGTTASDSIGSNTGTVYGASWVSGKYDNALSFDGIDDYVDIPDYGYNTDYSVSAWVYINDASTNSIFGATSYDRLMVNNYRMKVYGDDGEWHVLDYDDLPIGEWVHFALTFDKSNNVKMYMNGELNKEVNDEHLNDDPINSIGYAYYWSNYFNGTIDDVRVYNRSLSSREVQRLYNESVNSYISEGDNFYNGTLGSTRHVCYYGEETILDNNKYACEYYDYEWMSNSSAYYPGTYSFTNETVGNYTATPTDLGFISYANLYGGSLEIIDELDGYKNVLRCKGDPTANDPNLRSDMSAETSGIVELYVGASDVSNQIEILRLQEDGSAQMRIFIQSGYIYWYDGSYHSFGSISDNKLYHLKVKWYTDNTYDVWFDGSLKKSGIPFFRAQNNGIDSIYIRWFSNVEEYFYIDAVGFSWDSSYNIGDNLYFTNYLGTETFEEYNKTEEGNYYGTYDFQEDPVSEEGNFYGTYDFRNEDSGDFTSNPTDLSFVDSATLYDGSLAIVENFDSHNSVLRLQDDATGGEDPQIVHNEVQATSGTREFWLATNDVSEYWIFAPREDSLNLGRFRIISGALQWWNGSTNLHIRNMESNKFYHLKFVWRSDNHCDLYVNGVKEMDNKTFQRSQSSGLNNWKIVGAGDSTDYFYWDAYGDPDNDPSYNVWDNINPYGKPANITKNSGFIDEYEIRCNRSISMLNEYKGHRKVIRALNPTANSYNDYYIENQFSLGSDDGVTIEMYLKEINEKTILRVESSAGHRLIDIRPNGVGNGFDVYYGDGSDGITWERADYRTEFPHIKIKFDFTNNQFKFYQEGVDEFGEWKNFVWDNTGDDVAKLILRTIRFNPSEVYLADIGYSWGPEYEKGDNINSHGKEVITALENQGWTVSYLESHTSVGVSGEFNEHKKFLNLTDDSDNGEIILYDDFSPQMKGTVELWFKSTNASQKSRPLRLNHGSADVLLTYIDNNDIFYWDGASHSLSQTIEDNTWYHLKIKFNTLTNSYDIYVNNKLLKSNAAFSDPSYSEIDRLVLRTDSSSSGFSFYIDSLSYSWDSNYEVGDNKIAPRCFGDDSGEVSSVLSTI